MNSIQKIEDLLSIPVVWLKHSDKPQWSAMVFDEVCELTMNNFPEEPLYTVRWRNLKLDIDDAPSIWVISRG
jgi:hypothetical protein